MSISYDDVIEAIAAEEPDYDRAAQLGSDAVPYLQDIAEDSDPMLAAKATYLASLIEDERSLPVLETAINSVDVTVRLAAASAVANLRDHDATKVVVCLLDDEDPGVRRSALESVPVRAAASLHAKIETLQRQDPDASIRLAASLALDRAAVQFQSALGA